MTLQQDLQTQTSKLESVEIKFPVFCFAPEEEGQELGIELDLSTGEYLGLLFSERNNATLYCHLRGLDSKKAIELSESQLVQLARRLNEQKVVKTLVLDYVKPGRPCVAIPLMEFCRRRIPEDLTEAERNTGYEG